MRLPVSFDDVWYFRREYRGDLVVTDGVLYYFPHTNAALEKARRHKPDAADAVTAVLGPAGEVLDAGLGVYRAGAWLWRRLRGPTVNRPRLLKEGLWAVGAGGPGAGPPRASSYVRPSAPTMVIPLAFTGTIGKLRA